MPDLIGRQIGVYQILSLIGRGGMGEVYRARDTRLGRDVAIKVLPASLAHEDARLARFEREAQLLAALNHPQVASIHGVEEFDGVRALVLELVEGDTLQDRLASGPIPIRESLALASQIADALAAAHEKGIVHRDLKPANVKVRPDGKVKVLDFGLAKALLQEGSDPDLLPTAGGHTREGIIVGTAAYMSPEQARAQRVDKRTDIWAFGCVLFEMLAGSVAFHAETTSDTIVAVLGREPDWDRLPRDTPQSVRLLLERCLQKDARRRLHDIADARIELEDALAAPSPADRAGRSSFDTARRGFRDAFPWLLAAVAIAFAGWLWMSRTPARVEPSGGIQVQRLTDLVGLEEAPAISPDGKIVAFVAPSGTQRQIWIRLLSGGAPLALTKDDVDHFGPRWSPDSASLIYFTPGLKPGESGALWEIPALGGAARRLVDALGPGDISHDGTRLGYVRFRDGRNELVIANRDASGDPSVIVFPPTYLNTMLKWSPDDRRIALIQDFGGASFSNAALVADISAGSVRKLASPYLLQGLCWDADSSSLIVSSSQGSTLSYPPSYNLWRLPIDGGRPSQLTFGEASYEFPDRAVGGQLVVSRVRAQSDVWRFPITGDPVANVAGGRRITRQTGLIQTVTASPDDSVVAFLSDNGGHANVWTARVADGDMRQITRESDPRYVVAVPVWSPRAGLISFLSDRNSPSGDVTLRLVNADGGDARDLAASGAWVCWSGDGEWLYFSALEDNVYRISKLPRTGGPVTRVRDDNGIGCQASRDGSAFYYARVLAQATGAWDFEMRRAATDSGDSTVIATVQGARVPTGAINFQMILSSDGQSLAAPLIDGATTNLWALSTTTGQWRKLTDFGSRNVIIARRIAWSNDSQSIFASVSDVDSDIVMLAGLQ